VRVDLFLAADSRAMLDVTLPRDRADNWILNRLVLIVPASSTTTLDSIVNNKGLLAIAGDSLPLGGYTRLALRKLDVWDNVRDSTLPLEHVSAVLEQVSSGAAVAGVVYATDLARRDRCVPRRRRPRTAPGVGTRTRSAPTRTRANGLRSGWRAVKPSGNW